ncbi:MAG: ribokinase [Synergistaceae bacterium]|nr:ribokinase [Synergistaceae bacterium]
MKRITVVGSYNVGLFLKGSEIPGVGQTLIGDEFFEGGGGKGSNQAVAAAKLGANVSFIGRIGADKYGLDAIQMYNSFGMSRKSLIIDPSSHTGISVIFIDKDGNNSIMVVLGANLNLCGDDLDAAESTFRESEYVGFQLENSVALVDYGIRKAHALGTKVLLDPAPVQQIAADLYPCIDIIKPNEHEATLLTGIKVDDRESALEAARWFLGRGVKHAIITLGEKGVVYAASDSAREFPAYPVVPVDTTGAGDCFSGSLMCALCEGKPFGESIGFANAAAALSVTRRGVVDAIPARDEVDNFLKDGTISK